MPEEEVLTGGDLTPVTRVGGTVRREAGAWTGTVQALLRHARARGVDWVPMPMGVDERRREVLSFIEGRVPNYPLPEWIWEESFLAESARRLRQLHDATVDFHHADARWRLPAHPPVEVVCHNDFAPYNFVFRDRTLVG